MDLPDFIVFVCLIWFFTSHQQHSDTDEAWTHSLSFSSQALYHWATALP